MKKHFSKHSKVNLNNVLKTKKLYEGKAKVLYKTNNSNYYIMFFKDDATAFNAKKKGTIVKKGIINNHLSTHIFNLLENKGIKTHFISMLSDREMLVHTTKIIPIEVVIRNIVAGSLSKRLGIPEGAPIKKSIVEFFYKSDPLDDPMVNDDHIIAFNFATEKQLKEIRRIALKINKILVPFFRKHNIKLVDYKLEFGMSAGKILLADEISPDGCRLWDAKTNERLDKDRFRRDLGRIEESYAEVYKRLLKKDFKF